MLLLYIKAEVPCLIYILVFSKFIANFWPYLCPRWFLQFFRAKNWTIYSGVYINVNVLAHVKSQTKYNRKYVLPILKSKIGYALIWLFLGFILNLYFMYLQHKLRHANKRQSMYREYKICYLLISSPTFIRLALR